MALPFGKNDAPSSDSSRIKGNLPPKVKQMLDTVVHEIMARPNVFGASIGERVVITEASIIPKTEEPSRTEARVVCEVTVTEGQSAPFEQVLRRANDVTTMRPQSTTSNLVAVAETILQLDMLNPEGSLHGGCAAFLIDAYVPTPAPFFFLSFWLGEIRSLQYGTPPLTRLFCIGALRSCSSPPRAVLVFRHP